MLKNFKKDYISWMILIGSIILLLEITFFNHGLIFSLCISAAFIYFGRKRKAKGKGQVLFWIGIILFCISIFNMLTFKFIVFAVLLHLFIRFVQSKKNPRRFSPILAEPKRRIEEETVIQCKPLLENKLFGRQKTPQEVYEWNDINIQSGVGDTIIDLSYTIFPNGETVIFIRNLIGNIKILIPYDMEVSIHHSVLAGSTTMFDFHEEKIFNNVFYLKTPGYEKAGQKIKIFTSLMVGNLEVSRI